MIIYHFMFSSHDDSTEPQKDQFYTVLSCICGDDKSFDLNLIYLNHMYRPGTSISKAKVKNSNAEDGQFNKVQQEKMPTLQDYIKKRDWIGAVALLES